MATKFTTETTTRRYADAQSQLEWENRHKARFKTPNNDPEYYADPRNLTLARAVSYAPDGVRMLTESQWNRAQIVTEASMISPRLADKMLEVFSGSPTVSPGTAVALAQLGSRIALPQELIDSILTLDAETRTIDPTTGGRHPGPKSEAQKGGWLANAIGEVTRPLFSLLDMPISAYWAGVRSAIGKDAGTDRISAEGAMSFLSGIPVLGLGVGLLPGGAEVLAETYGQTTGGQFLSGLFGAASADLGEGYLPGGEVQARQIAAARAAAPLINGHAWTVGRDIGSVFFDDPDSLAYRNLSGAIDLTANLLDPTIVLGVGTKAVQGVRAGARAGAAAELGARTAAAVTEREIITLAESAADYATRADILSRATVDAANSYVRSTATAYTDVAAQGFESADEVADLTARIDDLTDQMNAARADAKAARTQRAESVKATREATTAARAADKRLAATAQQAPVEEAQAIDTDMAAAIDELTETLGDEGLDAMTAKILADSPDLPGVFTDAIPAPVKRKTGGRRVLPGSEDGTDAVVTFAGSQRLNLRSVDDPVDNPDAFIAAYRGAGRRSASRTRTVKELTEILTNPQATYTDLLEFAARTNTGRVVQTVLRDSDVDGITDVFRLTGGEGGVWWTSRAVNTARFSEHANIPTEMFGTAAVPTGFKPPADTWVTSDNSIEALTQRVSDLRGERKALSEELAAARRKANAQRQQNQRLAAQFAKATEIRTAASGNSASLRASAEMAMGVRRNLGGKPEINHELLKQFLFGPTSAFDEAIGANKAVPTWGKAVEAANRAYMGVFTLGGSELARAGRKVIEPFAQRARSTLLEAMVRLSDTPDNLGLLQRLSNGKIDPELLKAVLRAPDEEGVLAVLGPAVGVDITRPIGPNAINSLPIRLNAITRGKQNNWLGQRAIKWMVDAFERAGTTAPRMGAHINLADPAGGAITYRNYLDNLPGFATSDTDRLVGLFLSKETEVGRGRALMAGMNDVSDHLIEYNRTRWGVSEEAAADMAEALRKATRTHEGGRAAVSNWWLNNYRNDSAAGFITVDGQLLQLPGPQLEAELIRGGLILPDISEMRDAMGLWGRALDSVPGLKTTRNLLDHAMDFWRSSILLRPAYLSRNIAEMQFRMFLTGHRTVFNDPLGAVAMASAMNKRTRTSRGLLGRFARYNKTASGRELGRVGDPDLDALEDSIPEFVDIMTRTGSRHDMRTMRAVESHHDLQPVGVGQPGFDRGWAGELMKLRDSQLARLAAGWNPKGVEDALAAGANREAAIVDWLMNSPSAAGLRRDYSEDLTFAPIWADPQALRQFVFDGPYSIRTRVMQYTANGNPDLLNFVAHGALVRGGETRFTMSTRNVSADVRQDVLRNRTNDLARQLRTYMKDMPEDTQLRLRVIKGDTTTPRNVADRFFDGFFGWSGRKENAWAMGPEFSYAFNDRVVELMPAMTMEARQQAFDFVQAAQGKWRPMGETMVAARAAMRAKPGVLGMTEVERVAGRHAAEQVKTLFYDALQRKQIFHQLRLVTPFAQPFFDTLWHWGRLMATRPYMMQKIGRLGTALSEQGSGVIYDDFDWIDPFTERDSRDPTQGFIYTDPQTGEKMFTFPLIGSVLGAAISPVAGFNAAEAMQLTAPVQNLNLAFQGDVDYLPGVGPLVSLPLSQLMPDDWFGAMPEWFRDYAFPYGEPDPASGIVETTFLPSWARRLTGALYNDDQRAYSYKGVMAYFVANEEYPGLRSDPRVMQQLIDDVQQGSKWMTFIRALGAAVLPASPTQEFYSADKDGRLIGATILADHYQHLLQDSGNDTEAATGAFFDTYGMQALAAILPSSEGDRIISGPGWEFYKQYPEDAGAFGDVIGEFFPGDFSYEAYRFQQDNGDRETLTVEERAEVLHRYLFNAEKGQLDRRAAQEGWTAEESELAEDDLKFRYGNVLPGFSGETSQQKLDKIRRALKEFPELRDTRGGEGAQQLFEVYDYYTELAQDRFGQGLAAQKSTKLREQFLDELDRITAEYGGWNETDGSVHTIARRFISVVTPRG